MRSRPKVGYRAAHNVALFSALWLLLPPIIAQTSGDASAPPLKVAELQSDRCPAVHSGEAVSFEFNPGFDPIWPVTGLRTVNLVFARLAEDGVTLEHPSIAAGSRFTTARISSIGNGFFLVEAVIGRAAPGIYDLVDVHVLASLLPEYQGPEPEMTVSPVSERYCITVVPSPTPPTSEPAK